MSSREEKVRKHSEEVEYSSKKVRQHSSNTMEQKKSEETETSHPEIDNSKLIEDAKEMMASLQIVNIEKTIAESMAKHMQEWQRSIMTTFATTCSSLIETAVKKTDKKTRE